MAVMVLVMEIIGAKSIKRATISLSVGIVVLVRELIMETGTAQGFYNWAKTNYSKERCKALGWGPVEQYFRHINGVADIKGIEYPEWAHFFNDIFDNAYVNNCPWSLNTFRVKYNLIKG